MIKLVIVSPSMEQLGINKIGDLVSIHDGSIDLSSGYDPDSVKIIEGVTKRQAIDFLVARESLLGSAYRTIAPAGKWSLVAPEEKMIYKNKADLKWYFVDVKSKYSFNFGNLTQGDWNKLGDKNTTLATRFLILQKIRENMEDDNKNEALDLNA